MAWDAPCGLVQQAAPHCGLQRHHHGQATRKQTETAPVTGSVRLKLRWASQPKNLCRYSRPPRRGLQPGVWQRDLIDEALSTFRRGGNQRERKLPAHQRSSVVNWMPAASASPALGQHHQVVRQLIALMRRRYMLLEQRATGVDAAEKTLEYPAVAHMSGKGLDD